MQEPRALMVFAAGLGTRMGALTADRPKPLLHVGGKALIDHALAIGDSANARPVIVNLHYKGDQIERHLARRPVRLVWEREQLLETGGGLRAALPLLGTDAVATLNSDAVWTGENPLQQLETTWDAVRMDALLLLAPLSAARGHRGSADFAIDAVGRLRRHGQTAEPGYVYLGAQIIKTAGLAAIPERVFSLNRLWDQMIAKGRAFGLLHRGGWCDVGRPENLAEAEELLRAVNHV